MFGNQEEYFEALRSKDYQKPVVHYKVYPYNPFIVVGERAAVITVDHPASYLNEAPYVSTSRVESYDKLTGVFETLNTLYVPVKEIV